MSSVPPMQRTGFFARAAAAFSSRKSSLYSSASCQRVSAGTHKASRRCRPAPPGWPGPLPDPPVRFGADARYHRGISSAAHRISVRLADSWPQTKAAHAVTYRINLPLIKAIGFILKDEIQYGIRILQIICQGIRAGAAPASAVVEGHHMESCPAQRLRQIEILLAARNPVEQEYHRVRPCACGGIECGQDPSRLP